MSSSAPPVSRRRLTIGLCTAIVAIAFEAIAVATALPAAARELNGIGIYAWAFSLFLIGMLFATVASGRMADRLGPAKPMIAGLVVFAAGLVVAATSQTMLQLIAGRLVQGLGSGTMGVAIYVCIARVFDPTERPKMFSYISTAWVLPSFVGPPVAAWLTHSLGWQWVFWTVLPLVGFACLMVVPSLVTMMRQHDEQARREGQAEHDEPEVSEPSRPPAALWAAGLAAVAVAALQLAGQRLDWLSFPLAFLGVSFLMLSLPSLMPVGFFGLGEGLPAVIVVRGLLAGSFFGAESFIPLMLVETRGLSLLLAGAVLTVGSIGWTTGSWLQSRPSLALRRDRIISIGSCCIAVGLALAVLTAAVPAVWVGMIAVSWVVAGLGMGLAFASTSLAVMSLSAVAEQGRNASSLQLGEALGASLFVGLSGSIFASLHPTGRLTFTFGWVMAAMALVALVGVGVSLRIGRIRNELSS